MKKIIIFCICTTTTLSSCSLLQRSDELDEKTSNTNNTANLLEDEVSRLNTKVSALETKMDVLTSSMERIQVQKSQPIIEAQQAAPSPQKNLAAPVELAIETHTQNDSAPEPPAVLPSSSKVPPMENNKIVEKDFRTAMQFFQTGKNLESARKFTNISKQYPLHILASHSLYWAGEANARALQWSNAIESWENLEKNYPRSAYLPETLSGLARAYENQGDSTKAKSYRETLSRSFPKSPVALNFSNAQSNVQSTDKPVENSQKYPVYENSAPVSEE